MVLVPSTDIPFGIPHGGVFQRLVSMSVDLSNWYVIHMFAEEGASWSDSWYVWLFGQSAHTELQKLMVTQMTNTTTRNTKEVEELEMLMLTQPVPNQPTQPLATQMRLKWRSVSGGHTYVCRKCNLICFFNGTHVTKMSYDLSNCLQKKVQVHLLICCLVCVNVWAMCP